MTLRIHPSINGTAITDHLMLCTNCANDAAINARLIRFSLSIIDQDNYTEATPNRINAYLRQISQRIVMLHSIIIPTLSVKHSIIHTRLSSPVFVTLINKDMIAKAEAGRPIKSYVTQSPTNTYGA